MAVTREVEVGSPLPAWRRHTTAGVFLTAIALGLQHVFEPDAEETDVVVIVDGSDEPDAWGGRLHLTRDGSGLYVLPSEIVFDN